MRLNIAYSGIFIVHKNTPDDRFLHVVIDSDVNIHKEGGLFCLGVKALRLTSILDPATSQRFRFKPRWWQSLFACLPRLFIDGFVPELQALRGAYIVVLVLNKHLKQIIIMIIHMEYH